MLIYYSHIIMSIQRHKASKLRKQLKETESQRVRYVQQIIEERGPLIRGTYLIQARRCGKPQCKCARGDLHPICVLTASEKGRTRNVYVKPADRERVRTASGKYQTVRRARAELAKLANTSLDLIDQLQSELTVPFPPVHQATSRKTRPPKAGKTAKRKTR